MIDQLKIILRPIAVILLLQSFFMFFCAAAAFAFGESESTAAFSAAALFAVITALIILFFSKHRAGKAITIRSGFILVILIWTVTGLTGAAPYILSGVMNNPVDAVFESISGFTTTGASILSDIESLPKSVLLWRAFTHFIGGGGIIVLSIAILPLLGIGGTHLMDMETSGINKEKLTPRITQTAKYIWILYLSLNAAAAVLLMAGGMNLTDAFTHASSAIATGGFSNKNNSVAFFSSAYIEWVLIFFMYIGSLNFLVLIKAIKGELSSLWRNSELKAFTFIILLVSFLSALVIYYKTGYIRNMDSHVYTAFSDIYRTVLFQTVSVISTTGFATSDYSLWHSAAQILILILFFIGGSSGSTSGGIKVVRHVIMFKQALLTLKSLIHPKGVFVMRLNDMPISSRAANSVLGFIIAYMGIAFAASFLVAFTSSLTVFESFTAVLGCIGTAGPGFDTIGPASNYGLLENTPKIALTICMFLGRLELFTVLVLFTPWFWRR